jgi:hypothetical protein
MSIIDTWREIEATGDLPHGFKIRTIMWSESRGWRAYIARPGGATNWLQLKKIPLQILEELNK